VATRASIRAKVPVLVSPVIRSLAALSLSLLATACGSEPPAREPIGHMPTADTSAKPDWIPFTVRAGKPVTADPREKHFVDMRQISFGGENAEAYWSPDGRKLILQSTRDGGACDQEYVLDLESGEAKRVSNGQGRTTCGYFYFPAGDKILFSSTHAAAPACPPKPDRSLGYVWPLDAYDIYAAKPDGSDLSLLIGGPGYDAEATMAFDGSRIVFTSTRDGDLDLYTAKPDGSDIRRITNTPGYDGGAFFSPDSTKLVWRASRPTGKELEDFRGLLAKNLVRPTKLELYVGGAEGQNPRQITNNGKANFGPYFLPDSRRVIFSSNMDAPTDFRGAPNFELYVVDSEGPGSQSGAPAPERITYYEGFDGFPMFSPDGRWLVFASNRNGTTPGETNLFVARWVE
jgi:TolB protein